MNIGVCLYWEGFWGYIIFNGKKDFGLLVILGGKDNSNVWCVYYLSFRLEIGKFFFIKG